MNSRKQDKVLCKFWQCQYNSI